MERWWQLAALPTNMGGEDVGGNDIRCAPCYAAAIFSCWERLSSLCTNLAGVDILTSRLPMLASFRSAYDGLRDRRLKVERQYLHFDEQAYVTLRGLRQSHYHPDRLPRTLPAISDVFNPKSTTSKPPQRRQRALSPLLPSRSLATMPDGLEASTLEMAPSMVSRARARLTSTLTTPSGSPWPPRSVRRPASIRPSGS